MRTYYIDETGFTGEDLMSRDQPLFAQATVDLSNEEASALIRFTFGGVGVTELKYTDLRGNQNHRARIAELVRAVASDPRRAGVWMAHKEFAMVVQVVQWWVEPLGHQAGFNLYKDGANIGMSHMMYHCLQGFWSDGFRHKILLAFQRMIRVRSPQLFEDCKTLIDNEYRQADESGRQILTFFWCSFHLLGFKHVTNLPPRALDIGLPGLVYVVHTWRGRHDDYAEVVHDQSSQMAKQMWMWDVLTSPDIQERRFVHPGATAVYPMKIKGTRFGDSKKELQLQICDVLAGASVEVVKSSGNAKLARYVRDLWDAGLEKLQIGGILPSTAVAPESLGTKGWDGNESVEWISEQMHRLGVKSPTR